MTVPTVEELLQRTAVGNDCHQWRVDGGAITVDSTTLRRALEDAYDPLMPSWPTLVEIIDA